MERKELLKKLNEIRRERGILREIELAVKMPLNSLSRFTTNGTLPKKWVEPIAAYLEAPRPICVGLPPDFYNPEKVFILKSDGCVEELKYEQPKQVQNIADSILSELSKLKAEILAVKAEKIPDQRNTSMGKPIWAKEQEGRIKTLEYKIFSLIP